MSGIAANLRKPLYINGLHLFMKTSEEIIRLLRNRDQRGISLLFEHYGGPLNGAIARIVRDERVAEEVLQDTLLKVWSKIDLYDPAQAGLFAWMMSIARHTAIDRARLAGYQTVRKSETFDPHVHDGDEDSISSARVDVQALTHDMDPKYLEVLHKMYLEGYTTSAIADELNLPLGTVKTRLRTGLQQLRAKVKSERKLFLGPLLFSLTLLLL